METGQKHEAEVPLPSMDELLDLAKQRFLATETYDPFLPESPEYGTVKIGYTFEYVSEDTVHSLIESGVDIVRLAGLLMYEKTTPTKGLPHTEFEGINPLTWEGISKEIASNILYQEMPKRLPELVEENERRAKLYIEK